jgi:hypothetical protein
MVDGDVVGADRPKVVAGGQVEPPWVPEVVGEPGHGTIMAAPVM